MKQFFVFVGKCLLEVLKGAGWLIIAYGLVVVIVLLGIVVPSALCFGVLSLFGSTTLAFWLAMLSLLLYFGAAIAIIRAVQERTPSC